MATGSTTGRPIFSAVMLITTMITIAADLTASLSLACLGAPFASSAVAMTRCLSRVREPSGPLR